MKRRKLFRLFKAVFALNCPREKQNYETILPDYFQYFHENKEKGLSNFSEIFSKFWRKDLLRNCFLL